MICVLLTAEPRYEKEVDKLNLSTGIISMLKKAIGINKIAFNYNASVEGILLDRPSVHPSSDDSDLQSVDEVGKVEPITSSDRGMI